MHIAVLLGAEHFDRLSSAAQTVFGELDPALELQVKDRPFAHIRGAVRQHSGWLRDGLATMLLITAALGEESGLEINGRAPQQFVNEIVAGIPGLRNDHRVIASLSHHLSLLMEAAPDPLLSALEQLLEGDGKKLIAIFQDSPGQSSMFSSSPHTGLLWALELIAWDPAYLSRAVLILTRLARIDPGGSLSNRPINSLRDIFLAWHPQTNAQLALRLAVLDQLLHEDEAVGWKLLEKLLPQGYDVGSNSITPRLREAGASDQEILTRGVLLQTYKEFIDRALTLAGANPGRWKTIIQGLHAFPQSEQTTTIDRLESATEKMTPAEREALWGDLADVVRHHRAHSEADWALPQEAIERLHNLQEKLAPNDLVKESLWLYEEQLPKVPFKSADEYLNDVEKVRNEGVLRIWNQSGITGVLDLASRAKAPRYVGLALGQCLESAAEARRVISATFDSSTSLDSFIALLSAVSLTRFGADWENEIRTWYGSGGLTQAQVVTLTIAWPHSRGTWKYVASLGHDISSAFWQSRQSWGMEGDAADLAYAIEQYLAVNRAEFVVEGMGFKAKEIPSGLILRSLDQFLHRMAATPVILKYQSLGFELQELFSELQNRTDVSLAETASREYQYLPILRDHAGLGRHSSRSLALDRYMAENPEFFVKILCDVFRPASERGKEQVVSEDGRARAQWGWTLLQGFTQIPGLSGDRIERIALETWIAEVRRLAAGADRAAIADQTIGGLLAYAPEDPEDHEWPHRVIRQCLEDLRSDEIERGMLVGRFNMRGVVTRGIREGGLKEHELAKRMREAAGKVDAWPRTKTLLLYIADDWEDLAKRADIRARQEEMRE